MRNKREIMVILKRNSMINDIFEDLKKFFGYNASELTRFAYLYIYLEFYPLIKRRISTSIEKSSLEELIKEFKYTKTEKYEKLREVNIKQTKQKQKEKDIFLEKLKEELYKDIETFQELEIKQIEKELEKSE